MSLDQIRYSMVWEDHRLLSRGLAIQPDDDVLVITSAGCNVLALLLEAPRSVTAIDMSPAQAALLELKLAGIRHLDYSAFAALMGHEIDSPEAATTSGPPESSRADARVEIYRRIRAHLPRTARAFWDQHRPTLRDGVTRCGRLERYFRTFQQTHLPTVWSAPLMARLLRAPDLAAQTRIFEQQADTPAFRALFTWYFGREMMAKHGRDPAQFRHVDGGDVGAYFYDRFRTVCTRLPLATNFYVALFLTGRCTDLRCGPPYLRPACFERLKGLVDRVHVVTDELERYLTGLPRGTFSKAGLSDIFEYMSPALCEQVLATLADRFRAGGRLAYWNLLVPRRPSPALAGRLRSLDELADGLWHRDRSWFYRAFRVEEVRAP